MESIEYLKFNTIGDTPIENRQVLPELSKFWQLLKIKALIKGKIEIEGTPEGFLYTIRHTQEGVPELIMKMMSYPDDRAIIWDNKGFVCYTHKTFGGSVKAYLKDMSLYDMLK